jgi:hypothetical protein
VCPQRRRQPVGYRDPLGVGELEGADRLHERMLGQKAVTDDGRIVRGCPVEGGGLRRIQG